jgi:hypothetical protein
MTSAQTLEKVKNDCAKWGKVIRDANIKAEWEKRVIFKPQLIFKNF